MMRTVIKKSFLLALSLSAAAVFAGPVETLERADTIHQQALAQEHGWSVTEPLMDEARAAMAAGDEDLAQALADRALLTAEQSLKQAQAEKSAWQTRVVGR